MLNRILGRTARAPETDVAAVAALFLDGSDAQFVDVRELEEWARGYIAGSVLIPLGHLHLRYRELDPNRPVVTICRSGRRSLVAADALLKLGFRDVKSMAGGVLAWAGAGRPLTREPHDHSQKGQR
jgi:rhodanese-related sulfurtransferase